MDIKCCKKCSLFMNQLPLLDKIDSADVMWVGLSAKKVADVDLDIPLSADTNSGKLINKIEALVDEVNFLKSNLVKCVPLDDNSKLRYPTNKEMKLCYDNLLWEINLYNPKIIFLLGLNVAKFVFKNKNIEIKTLDKNYNYLVYNYEQSFYIPIHHPSFIYVYRRRDINEYVFKVQEIIHKLIYENSNNIEELITRIA